LKARASSSSTRTAEAQAFAYDSAGQKHLKSEGDHWPSVDAIEVRTTAQYLPGEFIDVWPS
jgi:hypothetical protein